MPKGLLEALEEMQSGFVELSEKHDKMRRDQAKKLLDLMGAPDLASRVDEDGVPHIHVHPSKLHLFTQLSLYMDIRPNYLVPEDTYYIMWDYKP